MTFLDHEVHPYVEAPKPGYPLCICGLWRTNHMHAGISSAVCTCMSCEESRNPTPITYTLPDAPGRAGEAQEG